ncbi:MAG: DUF4249 domain-containing protein [Bacteroidales bacterium]
MHRVLLSGAFLVVFLFSGCVERYTPDEDNLETGLLVINAHLTDEAAFQEIEVSRSVALLFSKADPVSGCLVEVQREDGASLDLPEQRTGRYGTRFPDEFLVTGSAYRIRVTTPDGREYESDFDRLHPAPDIDSIYYEVEPATHRPGYDTLGGIRFFIDFTYEDDAYEFIRWELTETYEFHNPDMEGYILDVDRRMKPLTDTNNFRVCYITNRLTDIHSMSMRTLNFGTYIKKPFSFVPYVQMDQKLLHQYSLLVRQYAISEAAYHYWNELRKTSQEQGFLFDRQPALLASNICNVNDPGERVLGFFSMSGKKEIRGFARDIEGIDVSFYAWYCFPVSRGPSGPVSRADLPKYYARAWRDGQSSFAEVNKHCVDCRAYDNSTHIKPEYW